MAMSRPAKSSKASTMMMTMTAVEGPPLNSPGSQELFVLNAVSQAALFPVGRAAEVRLGHEAMAISATVAAMVLLVLFWDIFGGVSFVSFND